MDAPLNPVGLRREHDLSGWDYEVSVLIQEAFREHRRRSDECFLGALLDLIGDSRRFIDEELARYVEAPELRAKLIRRFERGLLAEWSSWVLQLHWHRCVLDERTELPVEDHRWGGDSPKRYVDFLRESFGVEAPIRQNVISFIPRGIEEEPSPSFAPFTPRGFHEEGVRRRRRQAKGRRPKERREKRRDDPNRFLDDEGASPAPPSAPAADEGGPTEAP